MRETFLYERYGLENSDVTEKFGADSEDELRRHFQNYGQHELRGSSVTDHMNLETIFTSERGHIFLAGWADRRLLKHIHFSIEIGYVRFEISEPNLVWYDRADVADAIGDTRRPLGFLAIFRISEVSLHPRICVKVNGNNVYEEGLTRFLSVEKFMNQTLGACAVLADMPIGDSIKGGETLYPVFAEIWLELLEDMKFAPAFQHVIRDKVEKSIIITLYRKSDMLFSQLEELAPYLVSEDVEVVLVGNDLVHANKLVSQLSAFCQINPIDVKLYLCSGNSGFSTGNNFGAEAARGNVLIFMNPDIFPPVGDVEQAFAFFDSDPGEDLHGALLYYGDGMLMHSGMYTCSDAVVNQKTGEVNRILRVEHFGKGLSHRVDQLDLSDALRMVEDRAVLVSAALWKIRASVFEKAGGMPASYIVAYYEDADFCLRFLEHGGKIVLDTNSRWLHMEGVGKPKPPSVRTFMWLNRIHYSVQFANSPYVVGPYEDLELL